MPDSFVIIEAKIGFIMAAVKGAGYLGHRVRSSYSARLIKCSANKVLGSKRIQAK